jgi:hypothetical protein
LRLAQLAVLQARLIELNLPINVEVGVAKDQNPIAWLPATFRVAVVQR